MSEKTNEEKLKILQERLATIQHKKEKEQQSITEKNKPVAPVFKEELVEQSPIQPSIQEPKEKTNSLKYFIIFFIIALVGYGGFKAYNSINFDKLFSSETEEVTTDKTKEITYHKSEFNGNYLIILNSFEDITIANAEVQNYISEGYKCDVFQLSAVSDSKEEIFQTYIGPFNKLQEANQYLNSTISIKESGKVIELQ
jgi:hypothetical protein